MAETDGTPRFRKSKPPKGANGSGTPTRNSRPSAKARKRAALRDTLPNGASASSNAAPIEVPAVAPPAPKADSSLGEPVVKKTMPTVIRSDGSDGFADTQADMRDPQTRSTAPMPTSLPAAKPAAQARSIRSALGSTLRMELTVLKRDGAEPRLQVRATSPLSGDHQRGPTPEELRSGHTTLPDGGKRSRKPTTPGFAPASPDPSARPSRIYLGGPNTGDYTGQARFEDTIRRGSDIDGRGDVLPRPGPALSSTGNTNRPRRPRRPGERTLIMTRRGKQGSKRDWVFVVLLVAALGLTASMFLSRQAPAEEVVDASAYDEAQYQEDEQDPFAQTTLRPYKAEPAESESDTSAALAARENSAAAVGVQATELRSQPSGAEVIAGNAVVGSTPVRVARGTADMDYVLKLKGHESKVVRVGPHSPPSILVQLADLTPKAPPEPPADTPRP